MSDRDYVLEFLAAAAIIGMHLSRLAADLALWATAEFGFVEFSDAFATGSSIMPQKKNPDVAELIRGKSGRLYGNLMAVLTVMKGLPLTYNSDMQEDKEAFFDSVDTLEAIGGVLPPMLASLTLSRPSACALRPARTSRRPPIWPTTSSARGCRSATATRSWARSSAMRSSGAPRWSSSTSTSCGDFSDLFGADVHEALTVEASLRARSVVGGTAPEAVRQALAQARALVEG